MNTLWLLNALLWAINGGMWTFVAESKFMGVVCWGACLAAIFVVREQRA